MLLILSLVYGVMEVIYVAHCHDLLSFEKNPILYFMGNCIGVADTAVCTPVYIILTPHEYYMVSTSCPCH